MTLSLRVRAMLHLNPPFSSAFALPKRHFPFKPSSSSARFYSSSSTSSFSCSMSTQIIEHLVLFKVKDDVEPAQINTMIGRLNALSSLEQVLHLTAGPIHRSRSSSFQFTHMLHSRYNTKEDLNAYAVHPSHVAVVNEAVRPTCEDVMAVDWVDENIEGPVAPQPGSAIRVSFLKLKENLGDEVKNEILGVIGGVKDAFGQINQISSGENFSPARAKGFSIASLAVFPGLGEMEAVDSNSELVASTKAKVKEHLDSVIVLDYVVPSAASL